VITAAVMDMFALIIGGLIDTLPVTQAPGWLADAGSYIPQVMGFASSMGVWFPWDVLAVVLVAVFGVWVAAFGIKVVRIIISHVTGGGGSAA
jgi:hypothetical protein